MRVSYSRAGSFVSRSIAGETIVVPIRGDVAQLSSIFTMNAVAAVIWESLAQPTDEERLVDRVMAGFDVDEGTARADVHEFLEMLRQEGMVSIEEERP